MHLTLGADGEAVQQLQELLAERGYDVGEIDGEYGRRTRDAVASFQREQGLEPTGSVGPDTAEELDLDVDFDMPAVPPERAKYKQLLAENPNYFGNHPELEYEPVLDITSNTDFEELTCVGYDPAAEQLEAVVSVKRDHGYGGDLCTDGSVEFVRFFIDRERNGDWENLGVGSTRVHDLPGPKPVAYTVTLELDEDEQPCGEPYLPRIRAVLSWNSKPKDKPEKLPVWGNRLDADIQIEPQWPTIPDLIDTALPESVIDGIDAGEGDPVDPPQLSPSQSLLTYQNTSVPPHRGGFTAFKSVVREPATAGLDLTTSALQPGDISLSDPVPDPIPIPDPEPEPVPIPEPEPDPIPIPDPEPVPEVPIDIPPELDIEIGEVLENLDETFENTGYEELGCVGYRSGLLTGVFTVKRPAGYSGGLCTQGSTEYVAFWEKDVSGGTWNYLGTGSVNVYDIPSIPGDGLQYAVHLPVDLSHHRQPCHDGPSLVRIRAVLSWEDKPPKSNPNFAPTWGNHHETIVQVSPGAEAIEEGRLAVGSVGNIFPADVKQTPPDADDTGTATGQAVMGGFQAKQAPFGGLVTITGRPMDGIDPDASGADALKYRVSVRPYKPGVSDAANPWKRVSNEFTVRSYDAPRINRRMQVDSDGFYTYVPKVINDVLAKWYTSDDGLYELKVEAKRGDGDPVHTDVVFEPDGTTDRKMLIRLDNTDPTASISITGVKSGSTSGGKAGDCGFFKVGNTIEGTFRADDKRLKGYSFDLDPDEEADDASVEETSGTKVLDRGGGDGTWELKTDWENGTVGRMNPCGYTVSMTVYDNTIVNNHYGGHHSGDSEGFCLLAANQKIVTGDDEDDDGNGSGSDSDEDSSNDG